MESSSNLGGTAFVFGTPVFARPRMRTGAS